MIQRRPFAGNSTGLIRALMAGIAWGSLAASLAAAADAPGGYQEGIGARLGSWFFFPTIQADLFYDSNVYSSQRNGVSDTGLLISPRLIAESNFSRHGLRVEGGLDGYLYSNETSEDRVDAFIRASGEIDVRSDLGISASLGAALRTEDRGAESAALVPTTEPIQYTELGASVSIKKRYNRLGLAFSGDIRSFDFQDSTNAITGTPMNQGFRDSVNYGASARASYDISPGHAVFGEFSYNWRRFSEMPLGTTSDSEGMRVLGGLAFEVTRVISGEVAVGYMHQNYAQLGVPDTSDFSYAVGLLWEATPLIEVRINGDRIVSDVVSRTSPGRVDSTLGADISYEFRRNVVLTPNGSVTNSQFEGSVRDDWIWEAGLGIEYNINRYFSMGGDYLYRTRDSNIVGASYDRHIVGVNAKAKF